MQHDVHHPVLVEEVMELLRPKSGLAYVDLTVGGGGHAEAILKRSSPEGRVLGIDRDPAALKEAGRRLSPFGSRVQLRRGSFAQIAEHLQSVGWGLVAGLVADLGLSSLQLVEPLRGFSFSTEAPLDMRFDPDAQPTAAELVNRLSERELADILFRFGQERKARAIARRIVRSRPLSTTTELRHVVHRALGARRRGGIDPATRTFQALRIAVNGELDALETLLARAGPCLAPGGRLVILSYHSLEDRLVKQGFRKLAHSREGPQYRILTPKPRRPSDEEIASNRRARSAKLRALEREV